jgi:hypothetical protein
MYKINRPELGMVGWGTTFDMLETNCRTWCRANGFPMGLGYREHLEQEICKLYPNECEVSGGSLNMNARHTLDDIVSGTKVILSLKRSGDPLVPKEEAIRRGEICSRCKLCVTFPKPCNGLCPSLKDVVDQIIGGNYSTPFDEDIRACSVCHCYYAAHIRIPYVHLNKGLNDTERQQFQEAKQLFGCWKTEGAM